MSDAILYTHSDFRLSPSHWRSGTLKEAEQAGMPDICVEPVMRDPLETVNAVSDRLRAAEDTCGEVVQFAARVAFRPADLNRLQVVAREQGFDLWLSGSDGITEAARPLPGVWLGYLVLGGERPSFPEGSVLLRGLAAGHCVTVRTAVLIPGSRLLPQDARSKANLDVIDRQGTQSLPGRPEWLDWVD